jgi:hypothetical protein
VAAGLNALDNTNPDPQGKAMRRAIYCLIIVICSVVPVSEAQAPNSNRAIPDDNLSYPVMITFKDGAQGSYEITVDMEIAALAYHYWEQRGQICGTPELDWYHAVDDINRERTRQGFDLV